MAKMKFNNHYEYLYYIIENKYFTEMTIEAGGMGFGLYGMPGFDNNVVHYGKIIENYIFMDDEDSLTMECYIEEGEAWIAGMALKELYLDTDPIEVEIPNDV